MDRLYRSLYLYLLMYVKHTVFLFGHMMAGGNGRVHDSGTNWGN
jgi:hypothetical protein